MVLAGSGPSAASRGRRSVAPTEAWSAFSGTWQQVKIGQPLRECMFRTSGVVTLAFVASFAGIAVIFAPKGDTRIWSLPFVLVAVAHSASHAGVLSQRSQLYLVAARRAWPPH